MVPKNLCKTLTANNARILSFTTTFGTQIAYVRAYMMLESAGQMAQALQSY